MTVTVVIGPPASGKSTWVREHARYGDVIIDFDTIARALTTDTDTTDRQRVPANLLSRATMAARQAAIRTCLTARDGKAFIIHATPTTEDLLKYARRGATITVIDPGRTTVMQRIRTQRSPTIYRIAARWYDQLLPNYPPGLLP